MKMRADLGLTVALLIAQQERLRHEDQVRVGLRVGDELAKVARVLAVHRDHGEQAGLALLHCADPKMVARTSSARIVRARLGGSSARCTSARSRRAAAASVDRVIVTAALIPPLPRIRERPEGAARARPASAPPAIPGRLPPAHPHGPTGTKACGRLKAGIRHAPPWSRFDASGLGAHAVSCQLPLEALEITQVANGKITARRMLAVLPIVKCRGRHTYISGDGSQTKTGTYAPVPRLTAG